MAASGFFSDWDTDDPADGPQPFFGSFFKDWPSLAGGWDNALRPLPAPRLFPGSLAPPGYWALKVSSPVTPLAATAPSPDLPQAPPSPVSVTPPLGPVPEEIKAKTGDEADKALETAGKAAGDLGEVVSLIPDLDRLGDAVGWMGRLLEIPAVRRPFANAIRNNVVNSVQAEIDRINNAYGQQLFINGGGMPHR